jgi:hypothetical protein
MKPHSCKTQQYKTNRLILASRFPPNAEPASRAAGATVASFTFLDTKCRQNAFSVFFGIE